MTRLRRLARDYEQSERTGVGIFWFVVFCFAAALLLFVLIVGAICSPLRADVDPVYCCCRMANGGTCCNWSYFCVGEPPGCTCLPEGEA